MKLIQFFAAALVATTAASAAPAATTAAEKPTAAAPPMFVSAEAKRQPSPKIQLGGDGLTATFKGSIELGDDSSVKQFLADHPGVKILILDSPGGSMLAAAKIAETLKPLNLHTHVANDCMSGCSLMFLAGQKRSVTRSAKIGFHRAKFPPVPGSKMPPEIAAKMDAEINDILSYAYTQAGVAPDFIRNVLKIPADQMWHPNYEEMEAAGVVTERSLGGLTNNIASFTPDQAAFEAQIRSEPMWRAFAARFPDEFRHTLENGWKTIAQGGNDGAIVSSLRRLLIAKMREIYWHAPDSTILRLNDISLSTSKRLAQMTAAECVAWTEGRLHAPTAFDPANAFKEVQLLQEALEAPIQTPSQARIDQGFRDLEMIQPIYDRYTAAHKARSPQTCQLSLDLGEAIARIPESDRAMVIRAMKPPASLTRRADKPSL